MQTYHQNTRAGASRALPEGDEVKILQDDGVGAASH